jgi:hypothetical protein
MYGLSTERFIENALSSFYAFGGSITPIRNVRTLLWYKAPG